MIIGDQKGHEVTRKCKLPNGKILQFLNASRKYTRVPKFVIVVFIEIQDSHFDHCSVNLVVFV